MQPLFMRGPSITLRTILLIIFSIMLMMVDHRWHHLESARSLIESVVIYPLRYAINLPAQFISWGDESLSSHQFLLAENKQLKEQSLRAQVSLQKLSILEKENERLRKMLSAQPKVGEEVLVAELLSIDLDPYKQQVIINKGDQKNVYLGQPIIDAWGVMGQIIHTGKYSATAMLISDPSHAIPVQVNRNGLRSTAFGTGHPHKLELRYIPHNAEIEVGDLMVTSGLGGRFPPNYPVGRIIEIDRPAGETFARVIAEPVAHLDRSREVLLVWHNPPQPESEPEPEPESKEDPGPDSENESPAQSDTGKKRQQNAG
ncbi:MAG: rod shape-determining protein MreC [Gammaproteobacteria bacterium]|nr:rod shape-determining protein MreC [Gammaproteobacteria bacterium]